MVTPTAARNSISKLTTKDWMKAAQMAAEIEVPWFRCQALAKAATLAPDKSHQRRLLHEAFEAGSLCGEANPVATVSSWPVKASYALGHRDLANDRVLSLLRSVRSISSPVRQADALNYLLGAAMEASDAVFWQLFNALLNACRTTLESGRRNQKGQRYLVAWAAYISQRDPEQAAVLLNAIEGPTHKKLAVAAIERKSTNVETETIHWPNL